MILSLYASCSSNFQLVFKRNPLLHQFFSSLLSSISPGKSRHLKPIELKFCASLRFVGGAARVISTSGTFRATFVSEYVWPKTSKNHVTRLQWSRSLFAVHVWTLDKAVSGCGTPSTLFSFLFKSSHVRPINICEVKYFLYNQSVWDVRKLIFYPHFVFETKDFHPLCDSSWRRTCWFFFSSESGRRSKKLKISRLLASNHKLLTTVWR